MSNEGNIVEFWKNLGTELTPDELIAYSNNGPVRQILREIVPTTTQPKNAVEIGAMLAPLSFEIPEFKKLLLVDPVYSKTKLPNSKTSKQISTLATPLPDAIPAILRWTNEKTTLILENVLNYLSKDTAYKLLSNSHFTSLILGNNSGASFGDKHPDRFTSSNEIKDTLVDFGFQPVTEPFFTPTLLAGVFERN